MSEHRNRHPLRLKALFQSFCPAFQLTVILQLKATVTGRQLIRLEPIDVSPELNAGCRSCKQCQAVTPDLLILMHMTADHRFHLRLLRQGLPEPTIILQGNTVDTGNLLRVFQFRVKEPLS